MTSGCWVWLLQPSEVIAASTSTHGVAEKPCRVFIIY